MFTRVSLWLGVTGAVIGTVTQFVSSDPTSVTSKILGVIASLFVALAGLSATQAASGNREKIWIKCRAAGEALKSSVYLYSASAPPFDGPDRTILLAQRTERALKDLEAVELRPGKMDTQPPGPLGVQEYLAARVDDQIKYYTASASRYQKKADFWRYFALAAAAASAALGAISVIVSLAPWVALLSTATASITAYVKNQRYELMIGLYQATAMRLQLLKDQWLDSRKGDVDKLDRDSFIQRCEETMSLENGGWIAHWSQQPVRQEAEPRPGSESPNAAVR